MTRWTLDDFWSWVRTREANSGGAAGPRRDSPNQRMNEALARWSSKLSRLDALAQPPAAAIAYVADPQPVAQELAAPEMPPAIPPEAEAEPQPVFAFLPANERTHPHSDAAKPEDNGAESEFCSGPMPTDYYEILQISRHADAETIHRVYRIMASRFHPDNPKTGDVEKF